MEAEEIPVWIAKKKIIIIRTGLPGTTNRSSNFHRISTFLNFLDPSWCILFFFFKAVRSFFANFQPTVYFVVVSKSVNHAYRVRQLTLARKEIRQVSPSESLALYTGTTQMSLAKINGAN